MIDVRTNLGKKIREQRKRLGLSQAELAEKVEIHEKQIYRIELGKNSPSIDTVLKLIDVLKIDIRILDINNINNFNPIKDEILSIIEDATSEELILYRNVLQTIKNSQRLTTKEKESIKNQSKAQQNALIVRKK